MKKALKITLECIHGLGSFVIAYAIPFVIRKNKRNTPPFDVEKDGYVQVAFYRGNRKFQRCFDSSLTMSVSSAGFETENFDVFYFDAKKETDALVDAHGKPLDSDAKLDKIMTLCKNEYKNNVHLTKEFTIYQIDVHYVVTNIIQSSEGVLLYFHENERWAHPVGFIDASFACGFRYLK